MTKTENFFLKESVINYKQIENTKLKIMFFTLTLLYRYDYRVNRSQIKITIHYFIIIYKNGLKYIKNLNYSDVSTGNDTRMTPDCDWISPHTFPLIRRSCDTRYQSDGL